MEQFKSYKTPNYDPIQRCWVNMLNRCYDPTSKYFPRYGGRGITVSDEFRESYNVFKEFCKSAGWQRGLEIDRRDNSGNYTRDNIRFVDRTENLRNRDWKVMINYHGRQVRLPDLMDELEIDLYDKSLRSSVAHRIQEGWVEELWFKPPHYKHQPFIDRARDLHMLNPKISFQTFYMRLVRGKTSDAELYAPGTKRIYKKNRKPRGPYNKSKNAESERIANMIWRFDKSVPFHILYSRICNGFPANRLLEPTLRTMKMDCLLAKRLKPSDNEDI